MLAKNQCYEMTCESFGQDAQGVCRQDGIAVFVPGLLPGERARVRIVKPEKRYAFGRIEELLEKSPNRAEPFCPIYKRCGGCVCQHMTYETSLAFKRRQVQDLLERVGGLSIEVPPVLGMAHPFGYRNKGAYPVAQVGGAPACGFFAPRSHDLIPLPQNGCAIQGEDSAKATQAVLAWMRQNNVPAYDELAGRGLVRHIMTRSTTHGELMVVLVVTRADIPKASQLIELLKAAVPGLCSICLSINSRRTNVILGTDIRVLWGKDTMEDTLCGLRFSVSPLSFFQVNPVQTEKLYGLALEYAGLTGSETVVDAYCGAGTISLLLAQKAKKVIGIEIVPEAIQNANENAVRNHIENAEFRVGATEELLPRLIADGLRPDVIVLDPPRKGCDPAVLDAIIAAAPKRVVYVSCGAPTLARDAKLLAEGGYIAEKVQCVDMFCWTGAVETVMVLSKLSNAEHIDIKLDMSELDVTPAESHASATYDEIKAHVKEHTGLAVSTLNIAQVKRKCGIIERECYNKPKSENTKQPQCPQDKETAIISALKFYGLVVS